MRCIGAPGAPRDTRPSPRPPAGGRSGDAETSRPLRLPGGGPLSFEVRTGVHVEAPTEDVWAELARPSAWAAWNPVMTRLEGPLVVGARHRLGLRLARRSVEVSVRLVAWDAPRTLAWTGGVPGLFTARHGFTLAAGAHGGTDVEHHERFAGVLAWLLAPWIRRRLVPRHGTVNVALKARVEGAARGP